MKDYNFRIFQCSLNCRIKIAKVAIFDFPSNNITGSVIALPLVDILNGTLPELLADKH